MLLTQELALLGHHHGGNRHRGAYLDLGLAGAALVELVLARRVDLVDKRVRVLDPSPGGDPVLDAALAATVAERPRKAQPWVTTRSRGLRPPVMEQLVALGVVGHETSRVLGLWTTHHYPDRDPGTRAALLDRLGGVVLGGREPDERTASLVGLVRAAGLRGAVFPGAPRRATEKRMKEVSDGRWTSEAVRAAVTQAQAATAAAATAAAAAASSG